MTARLTLINKTAWSTKDLRRWLVRGLSCLGARPDKTITCVYRRAGTRRLGYATIGSPTREAHEIRLNLPRPTGPGDVWDRDTLVLYAKTLAHEVDHNLGLEHREMGGCHVEAVDDARVAWAVYGAGVGVKPAAAAPGALCRAMAGLDKAETALARWTRKQALAKTKVAKYRRAVARWTRRLEAAKQAEPVRAEEA